MAQTSLIKYRHNLYVYSWTTGYTQVSSKTILRTETDLLAYALWLSNNNRGDEAELLIEQYCDDTLTLPYSP